MHCHRKSLSFLWLAALSIDSYTLASLLDEEGRIQLFESQVREQLGLGESTLFVAVSRPPEGELSFDLAKRPSPIALVFKDSVNVVFVFDIKDFESAIQLTAGHALARGSPFIIGEESSAAFDLTIDRMCVAAGISTDGISACASTLSEMLLVETISRSADTVCGGPLPSLGVMGPLVEKCRLRIDQALREHSDSMRALQFRAKEVASMELKKPSNTPQYLFYNAILPSFKDFENSRYTTLCDELSVNARAMQPAEIEGNIWLDGDPLEREALITAVASIDMATAAAHAQIFVYLEVGFNAGHSTGMMLSVFQRIRVKSFDICRHAYVRPNFAFLESKFGAGRVSLTCGDSRNTLPAAEIGPEGLADIVRIDGGHTLEIAAADLINAQRLSKEGALVLLDDCIFAEVYQAWRMVVDLGIVAPQHEGLGWKGMCVGRYLAPSP
jgi:hypothetical protein